MDDSELIDKILQSSPISYRVDFARITGSVTAGLMLSQSMYWRGKSTKFDDGSFEKNSTEWEKETGMTEKQQRTARHILETRGIMSFHRGGAHGAMVCTVYPKAIYEAIKSHYSECPNGSSDDQSAQMAVPECPNGSTRTAKRPFSPYREYSENTTESTPLSVVPNTFEQGSGKKKNNKKISNYPELEEVFPILAKYGIKESKVSDATKRLMRNSVQEHGLSFVCDAIDGRFLQMKIKGKKEHFLTTIFDPDRIEWLDSCAMLWRDHKAKIVDHPAAITPELDSLLEEMHNAWAQ
jgi:hypothetical protein